MDPSSVSCPHVAYSDKRVTSGGNVRVHAHIERRTCGRTCVATANTPLYRLHHPEATLTLALARTLLLHGCPIPASVADATRAAFPAGVFFTPLDTVPDAGLVLAAIARVFGVEAGVRPPRELVDILVDTLRDKHALLLLDTFEHVVASAPQAADLLAACPRLTVLVTSRVALRVRGEKRYAVAPLALPSGTRDLDALSQCAAVQLFVARAREAAPLLGLTTANAAPVARICALLDGLPLAIELAVARLDVLSLPGLLAHLDQEGAGALLEALAGGARDLPPRQRAMRETLAWSYRLLDGAARDLLPRLAARAGDITLEMVVALCRAGGVLGGGGNGDAYALEGLASLVESQSAQARGARRRAALHDAGARSRV